MSDDKEFSWRDDATVVLQEQPATAVYVNPSGNIVIRQNGDSMQEYHQFVFVRPENVPSLVDAILGAARLQVAAEDAPAHHSDAKPKDSTAAERQRRHGANKSRRDRDSVTVTESERDTDRDVPRLELVG
jgi:hypothetical protein